jgi:hypothetical protein
MTGTDVITEFASGISAGASPVRAAIGTDGNIRFAEHSTPARGKVVY